MSMNASASAEAATAAQYRDLLTATREAVRGFFTVDLPAAWSEIDRRNAAYITQPPALTRDDVAAFEAVRADTVDRWNRLVDFLRAGDPAMVRHQIDFIHSNLARPLGEVRSGLIDATPVWRQAVDRFMTLLRQLDVATRVSDRPEAAAAIAAYLPQMANEFGPLGPDGTDAPDGLGR